MIDSALVYLLTVFALGGSLWWFEMRTPLKLFTWLPAIVLIYLIAIALAQSGLFAHNTAQSDAYSIVKSWLLPMMLFLMMLRLDMQAFASLGRGLLIAYFGALLSLTAAFFAVFILFGFGRDAAGVFGALSGSWTGGTANMLAVAGALQISETQLGPALIIDSLLYTLWVSALLLAVPLAAVFDRWSRAEADLDTLRSVKVSRCSRRALMLLLPAAVSAAYATKALAPAMPWLPESTWIVLLSTLAGAAGSLTPLGKTGGNRLASFLLYLLIALTGSHATLQGFSEVPRYLAAGALILLLHAAAMLMLAKRFRLPLFSIGIASLANIGGVASAPILAAAYHRHLVAAAVAMAVMGYLAGTLVGLLIASGLKAVAV